MHRCIAIAWIVGIIGVRAFGDECLPTPLVIGKGSQQISSKFDSLLFSGLASNRKKSQKQGPSLVLTSGENTNKSRSSTSDGLWIAVNAVAETPQTIAPAQYSEDFQDEQTEQIFPIPSSTPSLNDEAISLNDVLHKNDSDEDDQDDEPSQNLSGGSTSFGWISGTNDHLGILELDYKRLTRITFDPNQPISNVVDVEWGAKWLTGPNITDLPPQLFNILINVGSVFPVNDRLTMDAMISPGWYTDFSNKGVEAFRLPWHIVSYYKRDENSYWVMGVTDLSRQDIRYLPVIGMVYAPSDGNVRLDLVFPKPRIAWRVNHGIGQNSVWQIVGQEWKFGPKKNGIEQWITLSGELGGGSWAISRADREYDTVTYRDYRLIAGFESHSPSGSVGRIELGWIFDRSVQYRSNIGNYDPSGTVMIRISSDY